MGINDDILQQNMHGAQPEEEFLDAEFSEQPNSQKPKKNKIVLIAACSIALLVGIGSYLSTQQGPKSGNEPPPFPIEAAGGLKPDIPAPALSDASQPTIPPASPEIKTENKSVADAKPVTPIIPMPTPTPPTALNLPANPPHATPIPAAAPPFSVSPIQPAVSSPSAPQPAPTPTAIQSAPTPTAPISADIEKRIQVLEKSMNGLNEKITLILTEVKKAEAANKQAIEASRKPLPTTPPVAAKPPTPPVLAPSKPAMAPNPVPKPAPEASLPTEAIYAKAYGITAVMNDGVIYSKDGEDREINLGGKVPGLLGKLVKTNPSGKLITTDKKIYRLN